MDEARRVLSQIVPRGSPGPPPTATTQPPVGALATPAFQEGLPFSQVLEDGRGGPDGREGCLPHIAAADLDEGAGPDLAVGLNVDEAASR